MTNKRLKLWWKQLTCNHNYEITQWKYPEDWFKLGIVKTCTKCGKIKKIKL